MVDEPDDPWPWPWWVTWAPWFVAAMVAFAMTVELVRHEPFTWGLVDALVINVAVGLWLPYQRRHMEGRAHPRRRRGR